MSTLIVFNNLLPPPPFLALTLFDAVCLPRCRCCGSEAATAMQLLTGPEQDGNVNSRVMTTLSLHRSTELERC
jgi:hypothetical protein